MKKKTAQKKNPKRSWKDVQERSKRSDDSASSISRKRQFILFLKYGGYSLLIIATLATIGGAFYFLRQNINSQTLIAPKHLIKNIEFESNGVLGAAWFRSHINVDRSVALMDMDIYELKSQLEAFRQIMSAEITRQLPGTLKVHVQEREPLLKARIKSNGVYKYVLIAEDGAIYRGYGYPAKTLRYLPYVSGIPIRQDKDGLFEPVKGLGQIAVLLEMAREDYSQLYQSWFLVDLSHYQENVQLPDVYIQVKSKEYGDVVFLPQAFTEQLERLDQVVMHARKQAHQKIEKIDLSYQDQAVVTYAESL